MIDHTTTITIGEDYHGEIESSPDNAETRLLSSINGRMIHVSEWERDTLYADWQAYAFSILPKLRRMGQQ